MHFMLVFIFTVISDSVWSFRNPRCLWTYLILVFCLLSFGGFAHSPWEVSTPRSAANHHFITLSLDYRLLPLFFLADRWSSGWEITTRTSLLRVLIPGRALRALPRDADALPLQVEIQEALPSTCAPLLMCKMCWDAMGFVIDQHLPTPRFSTKDWILLFIFTKGGTVPEGAGCVPGSAFWGGWSCRHTPCLASPWKPRSSGSSWALMLSASFAFPFLKKWGLRHSRLQSGCSTEAALGINHAEKQRGHWGVSVELRGSEGLWGGFKGLRLGSKGALKGALRRLWRDQTPPQPTEAVHGGTPPWPRRPSAPTHATRDTKTLPFPRSIAPSGRVSQRLTAGIANDERCSAAPPWARPLSSRPPRLFFFFFRLLPFHWLHYPPIGCVGSVKPIPSLFLKAIEEQPIGHLSSHLRGRAVAETN